MPYSKVKLKGLCLPDLQWKQVRRWAFFAKDLEEKLPLFVKPLFYDAMDEVLGPIEARKLVETELVRNYHLHAGASNKALPR